MSKKREREREREKKGGFFHVDKLEIAKQKQFSNWIESRKLFDADKKQTGDKAIPAPFRPIRSAECFIIKLIERFVLFPWEKPRPTRSFIPRFYNVITYVRARRVSLSLCRKKTEKEEKFVNSYHRWILHLRFDGDTKNLPQNWPWPQISWSESFSFCIVLSAHREDKAFPKNHIVLLKNERKISSSFNTANMSVLTATLWFCVKFH